MSTWVEVQIMPRPEILDVEGRAIMKTLTQSEKQVEDCRFGKCIRLLIQENDPKKVIEKANQLAKTVLHNPLTETYEVKILSQKK